MIGHSLSMRRVMGLIERAAQSKIPVLIFGETGTGKEITAKKVHELSGRKGPFVPINCAGFSPSLIEAELFGHEKGSFTGADRRHEGVFEQANAGTLFLDEITEMPAEAQAKLLRVLEGSRVRRLGGKEKIAVDVRFIVASNRPLHVAVREGRLRADLRFRLEGLRIQLPPLRSRREELPTLVGRFIEEANQEQGKNVQGADEEYLQALRRYRWPGNIRELKHVVALGVVLCEARNLSPDNLPDHIATSAARDDSFTADLGSPLDDILREYVWRTVRFAGGNKEHAAEILGVSRGTLYKYLARYEERRAVGSLHADGNGNGRHYPDDDSEIS